MWYLLSPQTGSDYSISIPNTSPKPLYVQASSYKAASGKTSILDVANGAIGESKEPSVSVTTTLGGDVITGVCGSDAFQYEASFGTVLNASGSNGYWDCNQYYLQSTAGVLAATWKFSTTPPRDDGFCICVAAFKETISTQTVSVSNLPLSLALKIPTFNITGDQTLEMTALPLSLALKYPSIYIQGNQTVLISALPLSLSLKAPVVVAVRNVTVSISALSLSLSIKNPSIKIGDNQTIIISALSLSLVLNSTTVAIIENRTVEVTRLELKAVLKIPVYVLITEIISWTAGQIQRLTLTENAVIQFNPPSAACFLKLIINNRGSYTVTWPSNVYMDSVVAANKKSSVLFDYSNGDYFGIIE